MGIQVIYSVKAKNWYDRDEAWKRLDSAVAEIQVYLEAGEWAVIGFPYGIGAHYIFEVYLERDNWDIAMPGLDADRNQKAVVHQWYGSPETAREAIVSSGSDFCISLLGKMRCRL